jgi:outer membrane protein assembly factor BamD (BamD/ComL family)
MTTLLSLIFCLAQSRVELIDGNQVIGELKSLNLTEAVINTNDEELTLKANQIFNVIPQRTSRLNEASIALDNGNFQNACNILEDYAENTSDWQKEYASLLAAEAYRDWASQDINQAASALSKLESFINSFPNSFWIPRAQMAYAELLAKNGKIDEATGLMSTLSDKAFELQLPQHIDLQANVMRCEAFLIGNQAQVAQSRLKSLETKINSVLNDSETPPSMYSLVKELQAKVQIMTGRALEATEGLRGAKSYWDTLATNSSAGPTARAAAWLGLAEIELEAQNYRAAQLQLAKVIALMPESNQVTPKALYQLAKVSKQLTDKSTQSSSVQKLKNLFPLSSWTIKADSEGL